MYYVKIVNKSLNNNVMTEEIDKLKKEKELQIAKRKVDKAEVRTSKLEKKLKYIDQLKMLQLTMS